MESFKESGSIEYTCDFLTGLEYVNNGSNEREYEAKRNPRKKIKKITFKIELDIMAVRTGVEPVPLP